MNIQAIPAFEDNYLWLLHDEHEAVVVDPGVALPVMAALDAAGIELSAILITHHHRDHIGGIAELLARKAVPVYGPAGENIAALTHRLKEGDEVNLGNLGRFSVLDIPGHTAGHIAFYEAASATLFSGDTLFSAGCGRLFEGTPAQMLASLQKINALPGETRVFCTHEYTLANLRFAQAAEPRNISRDAYVAWCLDQRAAGLPTLPTTLARERVVNPFLRVQQPGVIEAASQFAEQALRSELAVFAALRLWKNNFS